MTSPSLDNAEVSTTGTAEATAPAAPAISGSEWKWAGLTVAAVGLMATFEWWLSQRQN